MDRPAEPPRQRPIRVLLSNLHGVITELLADLLVSEPTAQLVGQVDDVVEVLLKVGEGVDVLILGAPSVRPPPAICSHLLMEYPDLRVIVVTTMGEEAMLYWFGLRQRRLRAVSPSALRACIRRAYQLNPAA